MKALLVSLVMLFPVSAHAVTITPEFCFELETTARNIMTKRQENVLISDVMKAVTSVFDKDDPYGVLLWNLVVQAYERPLFQTEEAKAQSINDFANNVSTNCFKIVD